MTDEKTHPPDPISWWDLSDSWSPADPGRETKGATDRLKAASGQAFEDRFPFQEPVAEGGMGTIHLARDLNLGRLVAVKVLRPEIRHSRKATHRFLREARITAQLAHPSVVPLHSLDSVSSGDPALVMKWIEGMTFDDYVDLCWEAHDEGGEEKETYSLATRLEHFLRVCDAIAYAHGRGVLHRDLKPANLMVGPYGDTYVMDWGLAKAMGTAEDHQEGPLHETDANARAEETRHGSVAGTPGYMSPEQAEGELRSLTPASDQYSLGLVLYHLLTFRRPRASVGGQSVIEMARHGEMRTFGETPTEPVVAPELRAIVGRATAFAPEGRYDSVAAMAADIRRFLRREEVDAYPDGLAGRLWRKVERHPVAILSAILLVVALAATISIIGLYGRWAAEREGAQRAQTIAGLVSKVSEHALEIDRLLFRVENLVAGLAVGISEGMTFESTSERNLPEPHELELASPPVDTMMLERFGDQKVSFEMPVQVRAPDADPTILDELSGRLAGQADLFRRLYRRSAGPELDGMSPEQALDALVRGASPIRYLYAGLEPGLLLNYPGVSTFPADYDPRHRPWYRESLERAGLRWGRPYPDASGSGWLVPCNLALRLGEPQPIGVVGADLALTRIVDALEVDDIEASRATLIIDSDLRIVADTRRTEPALGSGLHDQRSLETRALQLPELEERLRPGSHSGFHLDGDSLFVFARLQSLSWYLVVEIDSNIALETAQAERGDNPS